MGHTQVAFGTCWQVGRKWLLAGRPQVAFVAFAGIEAASGTCGDLPAGRAQMASGTCLLVGHKCFLILGLAGR